MKKIKRILVCLMLCVFGFGLIACDNRTPEEKNFTYPSGADVVYGNGGLSVRKGNYVYFVNGYKSVTTSGLTKDTTYNVGSLMLMKLGANGEVVTNENGLLRDEYFISMSNRLCGYEATNLFIHGEYLYFVSPCLENESGDKVWAKDRVVFNRIKLDKTSKVEEVYSSGVKYDSLEYKYYAENGNLFILAWEKGNSYYSDHGKDALIRINATTGESLLVSNDVTDVVFADKGNEIFFIKHSASDEYYYLRQYNVLNNSATAYTSFDTTFDVIAVEDGQVFITTSHDFFSSTDVQSSVIETKSGFELLYSYSSTDSISVTPNGNVVLISGNVISLVKSTNQVETITDENATSINVIDYTNGCILYYDTQDSNSSLKLVSYSNALAGNEVEIKTLTTVDAFEEDYAYFDFSEEENQLYFYMLVGNDYYLHRIKVNNNLEETEEMFGVYDAEDVPQVEEEEEVEE